MGGNVGVQSVEIVVQGLANDSIKLNTIFSNLTKELESLIKRTHLFLNYFWINNSITIFNSIKYNSEISLLSVIVFTLFGTFVPLTLDKYKIDPH